MLAEATQITAAKCCALRRLYRIPETPGTNRLRDVHATLDAAVRTAYGMNAAKDILAFLLALNLELADRGAKEVQVTPPGPLVPAAEPAEFMSKDYVTVRRRQGGLDDYFARQAAIPVSPTLDGGRGIASGHQVRSRPGSQIWQIGQSH